MCGKLERSCAHDKIKTRKEKEGKKENVSVVLHDLWRDMAAI